MSPCPGTRTGTSSQDHRKESQAKREETYAPIGQTTIGKAIDQAVGSYMLTETQTINDDIDYERIREFAKGLVKDWCQIADGYDGYERMIKIKAVQIHLCNTTSICPTNDINSK